MTDTTQRTSELQDVPDTQAIDPALIDDLDFVPTTDFGRRLLALRRQAIAEGQPLLTREELEREIAERRGGIYGCDER